MKAKSPKDSPKARERLFLCMDLMAAGQHARAAEEARRALKAFPGHPELLNALGSACAEIGRLDEAERCLRLVADIYPAFVDSHKFYGGTIFASRHCHLLAYGTQRERRNDRLTRRTDKIRQRLGWEPGILNGDEDKPKGTHWRTFERLQKQHDTYVEALFASMMMRFGITAKELGIG
jgi:tetratricopeptide (TPR) repeat protein